MTDNNIEEKIEEKNTETKEKTSSSPVEVYAERAETVMPETDPEEMQALALAYAKYLAEHGRADIPRF